MNIKDFIISTEWKIHNKQYGILFGISPIAIGLEGTL